MLGLRHLFRFLLAALCHSKMRSVWLVISMVTTLSLYAPEIAKTHNRKPHLAMKPTLVQNSLDQFGQGAEFGHSKIDFSFYVSLYHCGVRTDSSALCNGMHGLVLPSWTAPADISCCRRPKFSQIATALAKILRLLRLRSGV